MSEPTQAEKAPQDAAGRSGEASPKDAAPPYMHALREYRLRRSMTITEFAALIGWSANLLNQVELGGYRVSDRMVPRLAEALGLSIESARQLADGQMPEELGAKGGAA